MSTDYFPCISEEINKNINMESNKLSLYQELEFSNKIEKIYSHLCDEESRKIFSYRLLYSLTKKHHFVTDMICNTQVGKEFINELHEREKFPIYIYGAGIKGVRLTHLFPNIKWSGFIDKNKSGECNGLPIFRLEDIGNRKNNFTILISVTMQPFNIKSDLMKMGVSENKILILREYDKKAGKNMYFESNILSEKSKTRTFVDVGCFDGNDTKSYLTWCKNENAVVEAFEADSINCEHCISALSKFPNVHVHNCGLSDKEQLRKFKRTMTSSSRLSEDGDVEILVKPLDSITNIRGGIGCIKMDIEGEEANAIKGSCKTIKNYHPDLAISIYHKREDIWNLPELCLRLNPNYRFYLRHYTVGITDTVMYAIDKNANIR